MQPSHSLPRKNKLFLEPEKDLIVKPMGSVGVRVRFWLRARAGLGLALGARARARVRA